MKDEQYVEAGRQLLGFLKIEAAKKGITEVEIAERTGLHQPNVSRMLACRYMPTIDNFMKLAQAIGVNLHATSVRNRIDITGLLARIPPVTKK